MEEWRRGSQRSGVDEFAEILINHYDNARAGGAEGPEGTTRRRRLLMLPDTEDEMHDASGGAYPKKNTTSSVLVSRREHGAW